MDTEYKFFLPFTPPGRMPGFTSGVTPDATGEILFLLAPGAFVPARLATEQFLRGPAFVLGVLGQVEKRCSNLAASQPTPLTSVRQFCSARFFYEFFGP